MCNREELLRQLIDKVLDFSSEEIEEMLDYANKEFEEAIKEKDKNEKSSVE